MTGGRGGFTLFEVLVALGVFALAVTGLVVALQATVDAALMARERALARVVIESRLAMALADPPLDGERTIDARDNNGIAVFETMEEVEIVMTNGEVLPGMWKLRVQAEWGGGTSMESAEVLLYQP
jgi:type II secretion system protein I